METRLEWVNNSLMEITPDDPLNKIRGYILYANKKDMFVSWIRDATCAIQARPIGEFRSVQEAQHYLKQQVIAQLVSERFDRANTN